MDGRTVGTDWYGTIRGMCFWSEILFVRGPRFLNICKNPDEILDRSKSSQFGPVRSSEFEIVVKLRTDSKSSM